MVNYVDGLARLNGVRCDRAVVETHDAKSVKRAKMEGGSPVSLRGLLRLRNEMATLSASAGVVAITQAEAAFFRALMGGGRVFCASLYAQAEAERSEAEGFDQDLLFAASENPLNERGILRFLKEHGDWLADRRVVLCGRICELPSIRAAAAARPGVELLGFVDDLSVVLRRTKACLSPTDGTGLKIKVVEALRHGRPVIASRHSMEGLVPGFEGCVFPIKRGAMERLLGDPAALAAASEEARRYFARLSGDGDRAELDALLRALIARRTEEARP